MISSSKDVADILWFENKIWYEDIHSEWVFFIQKAIAGKRIIEVGQKINGNVKTQKALAMNEEYNDTLNFFLNTKGNYVLYESQASVNSPINQMFALVGEDNILHDDCFKFNEFFYNKTVDFLKKINWVSIDYDFLRGGSRGAKEYILKQRYKKRKKPQKEIVNISSITSSIVVKGCDYFKIWDFPIYMFYEFYHRLIKIEEFDNTIKALYSGALDTTKNPINWEKINWSSIITIK